MRLAWEFGPGGGWWGLTELIGNLGLTQNDATGAALAAGGCDPCGLVKRRVAAAALFLDRRVAHGRSWASSLGSGVGLNLGLCLLFWAQILVFKNTNFFIFSSQSADRKSVV